MSMFGRVAAEFGVRRSTLLFNERAQQRAGLAAGYSASPSKWRSRSNGRRRVISLKFETWTRFFLSFSGLLCHLDDACTSNPCHEGAICDTSPINGSFACSCATGYKGVDCSNDIDECEQGKLLNNFEIFWITTRICIVTRRKEFGCVLWHLV